LVAPLASWHEPALDRAAITSAIPALHLQEAQLQQAQLQTLPQAKQQIARGRIQGQTSYQACLTRTGSFALTAAAPTPSLQALLAALASHTQWPR
jgi:hypothetical protein